MASRGPERRISETRLPCPPESGPSASDLRTSNDRVVSSKRDVRVFHKGNFPSSRSFLIYLDRSKLDPFTNVLPRTTLDPPSPVTRVIRLTLQVLLRSPTPACASLPTSLPLIGLLTRFKTRTQTGLLGSRMNLPYRAVSKHLGTMGTQTERAVFPHSAFMNGFARSGEKGSVRQGYLAHQRVDLLLLTFERQMIG